MPNYNAYIELSPNYESVVDIDSEKRNPNLWQEYIVHEDMRDALDVICQSLAFEDLDKRRSFWIHGAYGTGKSYAAIVLKHLFEDPIPSIRSFLSKQLLIPYRDRFIAQREKGKFLVIWKNQTTDIKNGTQLMMTMELAIRERLREEYGDRAYYGRNSLVAAAKEAIENDSYNWKNIFEHSSQCLYEDYDSLDEFKQNVAAGNLKACSCVANVFRENGWAFFNVVEDFKGWLKDIIKGNGLEKTGIVFIWDEFTSYIRDNPSDDVLQPLSEYCKEQPFFMCLIVHKDSGWLSQIGEETYERIVHRYHSLEFHISEGAAYEMIGNSILTRSGMETQWESVKDNLMRTIRKNMADFESMDLSASQQKFRQLCPIHPMTISMLTIVAQNFGAAERTLFRFMKDRHEAAQNVGFVHYINNYGYNNWRWLTVDFLWDYFFTRASDVKNFSAEANSAYQHYEKQKDMISDEYHMHVFKAAMLLIAVVSSGNVNNLYSRTVQRKISATKKTLYRCFAGILTADDVDGYLNDLCEINVLRFDRMSNGDYRLQIPYKGGNEDVFEHTKQKIQKDNTRYELFKKGGTFTKEIEAKFADKNDAVYNRLYIAAASSDTASIHKRRDEVEQELIRSPYKFGILLIAIDEASKFNSMQNQVKSIAAEDRTGRMAVCILKTPLTDEDLERWYTARTHAELASDEGKKTDAVNYTDEAAVVVSEWAQSAGDDKMMAVWRDKIYPSEYGAYKLIGDLKKDVIFGSVFPAAPEQIVKASTAYKKMQVTTALNGIQKKMGNAQLQTVPNGLKEARVWDLDSIEAIAHCGGTSAKDAIAKIAGYLSQKFAQGTKIKLDEMWMDLQRPPYGYYNCMACGYILGFLFRFYVNSEFSWNRGDNNPWPFTEQNVAEMIREMCEGKTVNHYLSPGSEVWQKFKEYAKKVFQLSDGEAVNETEARKFISKQCTENAGVPFWSLKYLSQEKFGGVKDKQIADEIIDLFCVFIKGDGDQESVMGDIITRFRGNGRIHKTLTSLYFDKSTTNQAFSSFVIQKRPDLKDYMDRIGLTNLDLFDEIHRLMQAEISTWTEQEVTDKLDELCVEYAAIVELNRALREKRKSIKDYADIIKNAFDNMIVPGSVIESMDYDWIPTMQAMKGISRGYWKTLDLDQRRNHTELIRKNGKTVWENITAPKDILKNYLDNRGDPYTDEELDRIYVSLQPMRYDTQTTLFENQINRQLGNIAYNRNKERINVLWKQQSGYDTVRKWCNYFAVPIQWVVGDEARNHIAVLDSVQCNHTVARNDLENATQYFETHTLSELKDRLKIRDSFISAIGDSYRPAFDTSENMLVARLKTDKTLSSDVYTWAHKIGQIRRVMDDFLRDKYCEDAKNNVRTMQENALRNKVISLLDQNPDLYALFID